MRITRKLEIARTVFALACLILIGLVSFSVFATIWSSLGVGLATTLTLLSAYWVWWGPDDSARRMGEWTLVVGTLVLATTIWLGLALVDSPAAWPVGGLTLVILLVVSMDSIWRVGR